MTRQRDLFRAIVISGAALTGACGASPAPVTAATAGGEQAHLGANTNEEAPLPSEAGAHEPGASPSAVPSNQDAMVLIL